MNSQGLRIATGLHSPQLGGSQITTIALASRLRKRGHQVEMFVIDQEFKTSALPLAAEAGFDVEVLSAESSLLSQAAQIRRFAERHDSQVVHVYHEHHWLGALVALALRSTPGRAPVVTNWMMENHRWIPPYAPLIVGFESIRDEARELQRGPVWLIEPPVDVDADGYDPVAAAAFRDEYGIGDDDTMIGLVTRVDRDMKLDSILRAISAIDLADDADGDGTARLVIVGDGDAMEDVRARAREVNDRRGREAVVLTGSLQDPRPAYSAADVVIGMGGSALRAMSFGKPLIVVGLGSFSKVFEPAALPYFLREGFFGQAEGDEEGEELAAQIRSLLDPARRAELSEYGLRTVRERFSLDLMADRLEEVYRAAATDPPSWWRRNADAAYVYGYDLAHRLMPSGLKQAVRRRVPRLRVD